MNRHETEGLARAFSNLKGPYLGQQRQQAASVQLRPRAFFCLRRRSVRFPATQVRPPPSTPRNHERCSARRANGSDGRKTKKKRTTNTNREGGEPSAPTSQEREHGRPAGIESSASSVSTPGLRAAVVDRPPGTSFHASSRCPNVQHPTFKKKKSPTPH